MNYLKYLGLSLLLLSSFLGVAQSDNTPPSLVSFDITTDTVNTLNGDAKLKGSIRVTDDVSGLKLLRVYFTKPDGNNMTVFITGDLTDDLDQSINFEHTIPQYATKGVYSINNIWIQDKIGNNSRIYKDSLVSLGFKTSFVNDSSFVPDLVDLQINNPTDSEISSTEVILNCTYSSDGIGGGNFYISYGKDSVLPTFTT